MQNLQSEGYTAFSSMLLGGELGRNAMDLIQATIFTPVIRIRHTLNHMKGDHLDPNPHGGCGSGFRRL